MSDKGIIATCMGAIVGLLFIIWLSISVNVINETERGVVKRGGKITSVASSGFNVFAFPVYSVERLSIQQDTNVFSGVMAYTKDQQKVSVDVSVTLRLPNDDEQIVTFYKNFKTMDNFLSKILRRNITDSMQVALGKFSAIEIVQQREKFNNMYLDLVTKSVVNQPIEIISVQIENISFSPQYMTRIEKRMEAEVEITTRQQNLETAKLDAEIRRTKAQGEADSVLIEKKAQADGILLIGKAESEAIEIKNKALSQQNSEMFIEMLKVEKWGGDVPTTVIGETSGTMPIIDLKTRK